MSSETYEIVALAARYWFIALAALIVIKGWRSSVKDNRNQKILRDWAGGAGCVGELVVLEDGVRQRKRSLKGMHFPIPEEGLIGSGGMADIRIRHGDVRRRHVWMHYQSGRLLLTPAGRAQLEAPVGPDGKRELCDGDVMVIGKLKLMAVFYDVQEAAAMRPAPVKARRPQKRKDEEEYDDPFVENFWE